MYSSLPKYPGAPVAFLQCSVRDTAAFLIKEEREKKKQIIKIWIHSSLLSLARCSAIDKSSNLVKSKLSTI